MLDWYWALIIGIGALILGGGLEFLLLHLLGSTKVKKNFKNESSTEVKDVVFDTISDGDFIMCKYRKDGSGDQGFDSLQFQIEVGF